MEQTQGLPSPSAQHWAYYYYTKLNKYQLTALAVSETGNPFITLGFHQLQQKNNLDNFTKELSELTALWYPVSCLQV